MTATLEAPPVVDHEVARLIPVYDRVKELESKIRDLTSELARENRRQDELSTGFAEYLEDESTDQAIQLIDGECDAADFAPSKVAYAIGDIDGIDTRQERSGRLIGFYFTAPTDVDSSKDYGVVVDAFQAWVKHMNGLLS